MAEQIPGRNALRKVRRGLLFQYWKHRYLVVLFLPGLIFYIIFHYIPMYGLQIAFKDYIFMKGIWGSKWIGLENFKTILSFPSFWKVLRNTVIISGYKLIVGIPGPIVFAILIYELRSTTFKKGVQTVSYLPHFMSWVILGGLFMQFLSPSTGPINIILSYFGLRPIYFLGDPKWFRGVLVATYLWKNVGWASIIYLAALSGINPELYEAAYIDGAGRYQKIRHVTFPALTPVITIILILSLRRIVSDDFDQIFNLYNPAVYDVADVLSTYIYRTGLVDMKYSFATAVGLFRNVIAFVIVIVANTFARRVSEYALW